MDETASVSVSNGMVRLEAGHPKGQDATHRLISSWPGWRRQAKSTATASVYTAPLWASSVTPLLRSSIRLIGNEPDILDLKFALVASQRAQEVLTEKVPDSVFKAPNPLRQPMQHQLQALMSIVHLGYRAMLNDDMGLGKSATALWAWYHSGLRRLLIVCPKSVLLNWKEELTLTLGDHDWCEVIDGTPAERASSFVHIATEAKQNTPGVLVPFAGASCKAPDRGLSLRRTVIVGYDVLRCLPEHQLKTLALFADGEAVILDESHYVKSSESQRTKLCTQVATMAKMCLCLTGTPIRNTVQDIYSQVELVRPGTFASEHVFKDRYLVIVPTKLPGRHRPVNIVRGQKNAQELQNILSTFRIARKKEEVLNLPEKIVTRPLLTLDGPELSLYKSMKDLAIVELEKLMLDRYPEADCERCGGTGKFTPEVNMRDPLRELKPVDCDCLEAYEPPETIFAPQARSALEAAMRCEQIAQGFLGNLPEQYLQRFAPLISKHAEQVEGYEGAIVFPHSAKMEWLTELIDTFNEQEKRLIVYSRFNAPLKWLHDRSPHSARLVGSMDAESRQTTLQAFQAGTTRILLTQVQLAEGWNATACSDVVFLSRSWSPAVNSQAEARCHRIGSKGTVNVQVPLCVNTIEKLIDKKLSAKEADATEALRKVTLSELREAL